MTGFAATFLAFRFRKKRKRFEFQVGAVAKNADEDGNCEWKYYEN
jgi:hypothetical protein